MSIAKAQAAALAEGLLDTLGSAPPSVQAGALPIVERMLQEVAFDFIRTAHDNLDKAAAVDTGELHTQLTFTVEVFGSAYVLSVGYPVGSTASKYYDFVNKGVKGTESGPPSPYKYKTSRPSRKMAAAIMGWMRRQGISATNVRKPISALESKRKSIRDANPQKGMAYAIATNIKKRGLKATHYFDKAVEGVINQETRDALAVALAADVRLQIRQAFSN